MPEILSMNACILTILIALDFLVNIFKGVIHFVEIEIQNPFWELSKIDYHKKLKIQNILSTTYVDVIQPIWIIFFVLI